MVTRLDGPSAEIARGLVDKAIEAETDGLWGRAYFDLRGITDPGYKPGDDWIRAASEICQQLGFETVVDENPATFPPEFPMSQIAIYCGWYDGNASGPFTQPTLNSCPEPLPIIYTRTARPTCAPRPILGRPAAGQRSHHHHGLRG